MKLPTPSLQYNPIMEAQRNLMLEQADLQNHKRLADLEIVAPQRLILRSPNGTRWKIEVDNAGVLTASTL